MPIGGGPRRRLGRDSRPAQDGADYPRGALGVLLAVEAFLHDLGWPAPLIGDSGNGYYLLYPVDLPVDTDTDRVVGRCLAALDHLWSTAEAKVDRNVGDRARLVPFFGTMKVKGSNSRTRPHRRSAIADHGERRRVTREQIGQLAARAPSGRRAGGMDVDLGKLLEAHEIPYVTNEGDGITWYNLDFEDGCPFGDRSGNKGKCGVGQTADGQLIARCFADPSHTFNDFATKLGLQVPSLTDSGKPSVIYTGRELNKVSGDCWRHIEAANDPPQLFRYGQELAEVVETELASVRPVDRDRLSYISDRVVGFRQVGRGGELKPIPPPIRVLADMLAESKPPVPGLRGIVTAPFVTPSGALVIEPGYNAETQLYYACPADLRDLSIPTNPSSSEKDAAVAVLLEIVADFPFMDECDRANAIAAMISPAVQPMKKCLIPLQAISATAPGSGKGKLIDALSWPFLGGPMQRMPLPPGDEELDKRIVSMLRSGQRFVHFDNASKIKSDVLAALLTSDSYQGRILGRSEVQAFPNQTIVFVSGNGLEFGGDMPRRTVMIRLDPGLEHPEARSDFRHPNLEEWMTQERARIVVSILTIVRAWLSAGAPLGSETLGSFDVWAKMMGGILGVAGLDGFLANRTELVEDADSDGDAWRSLAKVWWDAFRNRKVMTTEVVDLCESRLLDPVGLNFYNERSAATSMGRALMRMRGRIFDGLRIVEGPRDKRSNSRRWRLEPVSAELRDMDA